MELLEQISDAIDRGRSKEAEKLVAKAVEEGISARRIVREAMVPAMKSAGERYQGPESDIVTILAAARSMQKCLAVIKPYLGSEQGGEKPFSGTAIIGTIEGDLHEVGKNLVSIMFQSEGFTVIDLGVDISGKQFIKAIREHPEAELVCISALLSTTAQSLRRVLAMIRKEDKAKRLQIMVGGGFVTEKFAMEIGADAYTENAVDAAETARRLVEEKHENMTRRLVEEKHENMTRRLVEEKHENMSQGQVGEQHTKRDADASVELKEA